MKRLETKYIVAIIISLILSASILGYGYMDYSYKKEMLKQKIEQDKQKQEQDAKALILKQEQENKDYVAKRANDCYAIYEKERKQFNNVDYYFYDKLTDRCRVIYKTKEYEGVDCKQKYGDTPSLELECKLGIFGKDFF